MSDCLVLNGDGNPMSLVPLSTIPWTEAIKLIYLNKYNILNYHENWVVHSPSQSFMVPSVIMAKQYKYISNEVKFNRLNLLYRDDFTCQYCGIRFSASNLTMDHVKPKCDGGKKNWLNIVMSCRKCNTKKGHKYYDPIRKPHKPTYYEILNIRRKYPMVMFDIAWNDYIMWDENLIKIKYVKTQYNFNKLMEE